MVKDFGQLLRLEFRRQDCCCCVCYCFF